MGGFVFGSRLCAFSALVLQSTVVLLLTRSNGVVSQGVEASQTITALVGEDVVLPCHLEPAVDATSKSVEWARHDLEPRFVHVWHDGLNLLETQNPSYKGRTSLPADNLKHGDLSLKLSAVKLSDNGVYTCFFPSQKKDHSVQLVVGSFSSPVISGIYRSSDGLDLQSESEDAICLKVIVGISAGGLLSVIGFFGVSLFFGKNANSKILPSICSAKKEILEGKDGELKERSKTAKEELTACTEDLTPLKELKSGIKRLMSDYKSQLAKIEKEREKNEDMVKDIEVKIEDSERKNTTDITEKYLQELQRLLEAQGELEKRKSELEEKKLQTEKLLQKADKMDKALTKRLEGLKVQIDGINSLVGRAESPDDRARLCTGQP